MTNDTNACQQGGVTSAPPPLRAEKAEEQPTIAVIGAGLIGSLLSHALRKLNYNVHVYERYNDIRISEVQGKSINLVMTHRGLRATALLGIQEELIAIGKHVYGRRMWLPGEAETRFQPYGREKECNYSVSRLELNKVLINKAEEQGVKFFFNHPLERVDVSGKCVVLDFEDGKKVTLPENCPVIGADGGPSKVRKSLMKAGLISSTEDILEQGYKELSFLPDPETNGYCMDEKSLHIWPRTNHMIMGLPDNGNTFTGTIYLNNDEWPKTMDEARTFLETHYATAIPMCGGLDSMAEALLNNPRGILGTVRTEKWYVDGKACLIGDAAHAIVPFFGQGCNSGFEDIATFLECFADRPTTSAKFEEAFAKFHMLRKENADAIADMALENFVEMREKVGDTTFLKHKQMENKIEQSLPALFRSRYAMVCYGGDGGITYSAAKKLGKVQYDVIQDLIKHFSGGEVDLEYVEKIIQERIVPVQKELNMDLSQMMLN